MSTQQMLQVIVDLQDMEQIIKRAKSQCQDVLNLLNTQRILKKKEEKISQTERDFVEAQQQFEQIKLTSSPNASSEEVKQAIYKNDGKVRTLTNVHIEGQYTMALEVESNKTKRFFTNMLVYV